MDQRSDESRQKLIAGLMMGGIFAMCGSLVMIVLLPHPLLILFFVLIFLCGLVLLCLAVFYGVVLERKSHGGAPRVEANCRVMARYGVNQNNDVMSSDWAADSDDFRPFVRLYSPTRGALEFECAMPVWDQCGEGLLGEAVVQGRWLSSFTPYRGTPVTPP